MNLLKAETMARDLMTYHGLNSWRFKFNRAVRSLGTTHYRTLSISLSRHATTVNSEEEVLNTILHEIAHALVGSFHGHDMTWKQKAVEIGCTGERCNTIAVKAPAKLTAQCLACKATFEYYRAPKWLNNLSSVWHKTCGKEAGKIQIIGGK